MKKKLRKKEKELGVKTRIVINHNGSCYICLPKSFVQNHNIKPGDRLAILEGENLKIVAPEKTA